MNPNYIHTITIYNRLQANDNPDSMKDTWQRTVLHDCYYKNVIGRVESDKTAKMANVYTARIPESENYRPYHEWAEQEDRSGLFTASLGDIVVKGECQEEITGKSPYTATELLKRYKPDAFVVTAVSDNTSHKMAKHYRVGG
ncbi:hypothetical protein FND36_02935 [Lachnospiraceae bacterium KGMB03038]|mgnify:CR=1 FL=1|jgi:hypothetical protein|nr:hypothetical protein FND36_02935 [Lachnospiraceae bacterium KGMB03038]